VMDEMTAYSMGIARRGYKTPQLPADEQAKAALLGQQMGDCMQRAFRVGADRAAYDFIAKNVQFKERLCACKDLACGEAVNRELTTWSEAYMKDLPPDSTMSKGDDRKMQELETAMRACMQTLRTGHK